MDIHFEMLSRRSSEFLRTLRNENREWFSDDRELSLESHLMWIDSPARMKELNLIIKDAENKDKVGFISIYDISNDYATIGRMMVVNTAKHKGYMKKAMIKAFELARRFFGIKELTLTVKKSNIIARDLYTKMGFMTYGFTDKLLIMRKIL